MDKILVVGSLNMDFVIEVDARPLAGETVLGKRVALVPGGKGANQAYAAARLGGDVRMIGAVGDDVYGRMLKENLELAGVDTSGVETVSGVSSGNAFITVDSRGENSITVIQGANALVTRELAARHIDMIDDCDTVIVQLEIPLDAVDYVKNAAKEKGKRVILDPAPAREGLPEEFFRGFDIVKPNETELQILSGKSAVTKEELAEGARELLKKGVGKVIVTLGERGCIVVSEDTYEEFPAHKVHAVDTTAAGDSFTGAFAAALARGDSCEDAVKFGNCASGIAVTPKGAQTSIPTMEEVINMMKREG